MNQLQKEQIVALRTVGTSYGKIASELGISVNTIKSYFKRNPIDIKVDHAPEQPVSDDRCPQCHVLLEQTPGHRQKKFCSLQCRMAWWKAHPDQMDRKKLYPTQCEQCGLIFLQYGKRQRKFCSRECYFEHRYGSGGDVHG